VCLPLLGGLEWFGRYVRFLFRIARAHRVQIDCRESAVAVAAGMQDLAADSAVPVVLDGVVSSAGKKLRDVAPLVAVLGMCGQDDLVLVSGPRGLANGWVEVIMPPLATLLADTTGKIRGNLGPLAWAELLHMLAHNSVLLR
jgi:hypothetical protein